MNGRFRDRRDAGVALAARLEQYAGRDDTLVLGLPRGGVPVAAEVARTLGAPLDVFVVRKVGVPGGEELAMGAVASGGVRVVNDAVVNQLGIPESVFLEAAEREVRELARREALYRGVQSGIDPRGRITIIVDDGIATGSTMLAAVAAVRAREPTAVVVAVPVASADVTVELRRVADDVVCVHETLELDGVSAWYDDFRQTTDAEVRALLEAGARARRAGPPEQRNAGGDSN
ncbi:MAG TPA: phosphoribosyltransferase family protein [Longimicrobiales bacterium]|nr:phosphoribosyltransferase family protein [Longimicrobiales bacterium]